MLDALKRKLFGRAQVPAAQVPEHPADPAPADALATVADLKSRASSQLRLGNLVESATVYRKALALAPDDAGLLTSLGYVLNEGGFHAEACQHLRKAVLVDPAQDDAFYTLGVAQRSTGQPSEALESFRRALALNPGFTHCRLDLCRLLFERHEVETAMEVARAGIEIEPGCADLHFYLGNLHLESDQAEEAVQSFHSALALQPDYVEVHNNLAKAHLDLFDIESAVNAYKRVIVLDPGYPNAHSTMLFPLNYHPDLSAEEIFAEYRGYDSRIGEPQRAAWCAHGNDRTAVRRLKVGYVSPDFYEHAVRFFLEPLLANHDRQGFELYAYAELEREDSTTALYRTLVDHWVPIHGRSDEEVAERIRADGIDILVELAGHTAKNRLGVFARKPAPVSLSWMGYGYTTGLSAIDYFLIDLACAPIGSEALFAETPWRLANPPYAYRAARGMGEVGSLPAQTRGHVTFGTLTRAVRINHRTIRAWAAILKRVPGSRLIVDSSSFRSSAMGQRLKEKFRLEGIGGERIVTGYTTPPWDVMRQIDIGLDCFPHNSGTTLFESLYMGIPFVTLAGRPSVGRLGSSILEAVGHMEWIAESEDEYVELAVSLASNLGKLAELRSGLRARMQSSAVMDEAGFARKVEAAYREMFLAWSTGMTAADGAAGEVTTEY